MSEIEHEDVLEISWELNDSI